MLTASHLSYRYGLSGFGIDDISLEIRPGELAAVLGMNGWGKTTLGRALGGLLLVHSGEILLDGQAASDKELRSRVAYLFSPVQRQFIGSTVEEDILFGLECRGLSRRKIADRLEHVIEEFALRSLRYRPIEKLSQGEMQRAALAAILALDPDYLILDEPTAGLDLGTIHWLYQLLDTLKERGKGILVLTNQVEEAARADRILLLNSGRIAAEGTPYQLLIEQKASLPMDLMPLSVRVAEIMAADGLNLQNERLHTEGLVDAICRLNASR